MQQYQPKGVCSHLVDIAGVQPDGVASLGTGVPETQEVIGDLRWARNLCGPCETQHQQIQYQTIVLHDKGGKLQTPDQTIRVGMRHVLVGNHDVVLGSDVVCNVVVQDQPQQPAHRRTMRWCETTCGALSVAASCCKRSCIQLKCCLQCYTQSLGQNRVSKIHTALQLTALHCFHAVHSIFVLLE